jgi:hypothetical protein
MGTRHLTAVVVNGEYKIAQYGQWDGYPSGQGFIIVTFLNQLSNLERSSGTVPGENLKLFREKVLACTELAHKDLQALWIECGADPNEEWVTTEVSELFGERYPHLSRDCGAEILNHVMQSENGLALTLEILFAANSLFCEWAWVIDLDKNVLEVYRGFNKEPLSEGERFKYLEETDEFKESVEEKKEQNRDILYPVKHLKTYGFDELPQSDKELESWGAELERLAYPEKEEVEA